AGAEHAEQRDRVLQDVRHHECNAIAGLEAGLLLQPGRKRAAELIELRIAQRCTQVAEGGRVPMRSARLFEDVAQRGVAVRIDVRRHSGRVLIQPISIHAVLLVFCTGCIAFACNASNVPSPAGVDFSSAPASVFLSAEFAFGPMESMMRNWRWSLLGVHLILSGCVFGYGPCLFQQPVKSTL